MEEPEELTFHDLQEITDYFSEKRKVGEGAFGIVYKGVTKHGEDVAVKILRARDGNPDLGYRQFQNEFCNLLKVKHDNIVQVLAFCYETEQTRQEYGGRIVLAEETHRALCFEYLHNGSLQNHLSDEAYGLDWRTRYKIIKGTCEGLRYIHEEKRLLHLDLKPENILLDKNMVPKIADFGLSRIFGDKVTRTTRSPLGTLGYQPPEYIESGQISEKFDIFSLGVVIMRIVSGPDGYPKCQYMPSDEFIDQIQNKWRAKWQETCSNGFLLEACCHQVKTCTQIALDCLENDSQKRPDIVKIIDELKEIETDNNKVLFCCQHQEPQILQLYEHGHKTVCGMTRRNEMKLTNEHKVITDKHQNLNFMISSGSNQVELDNTEEKLLDVGEEQIVGRDEEKKKIVASLLESIKSEKVVVIFPIYGIGGIGKTTFAKLIYNDTNFKYYSHVWVYVSQRFDLEKIGKSIHSQLSGNEQQDKEQLIHKEILIVLDDLWEDNPLKIEELKNLLIFCESIKTIIVLVTTRSADIAQKICTNFEPYQIGSLTDEICWDIIKKKSGFTAIEDKEKLVDIGKKIAQKCQGVALAAQTLGSMLRSMKHDEWITVKDSDIWNQTISEDNSLPQHVLASLKLTYAFSMDDLLKRCFTYCAIFPKGQKIVKYDLIYQWISLGFIMPTKILSTFQRCEKYILRLVGLGFLQHSMPPMNYGAYADHDTVFTMHDLVHDLAVSLLGDEILDQSKQGNIEGSNYSYALLTDCSKPLRSCTVSPATLTALRFVDCRRIELHSAAFELAESLRVLDLSGCFVQELPESIGRLKQLGYFNAPRIRDPKFPYSITALSNLRYLCLRGSCFIRALPESIGEMIGLVHLDLSGCLGIEKLPESFGNLTNLEYVDFANCKHLTGVSQCLVSLTKLQHLNLSNCKNIGDLPRALGILTELHYLNLSDSSYLSGNILSVAELLGPLTQLKYFLGSLTKLKYLNLSSSNIYTNMSSSNERRIISLPEALFGLTALKYLNLSHHYVMGKLLPSFGNLFNLVHLDLSYCYPLQGVPEALNGLTKLQYLDLYKCSGFDAMEGLQEAFGNLSELRHLNLGCCIGRMTSYHPDKINRLLASICTLTNLEYLSLRENNSIYSIPEALTNLRNLHTLDLSSCSNLQKLPASLSEINSLKFLYTKECWKLDRSMLPHYKRSSRVSQHFESHTGDGESSSCLFQFDVSNPALLNISRLENVKSAEEAQTLKLMDRTDIAQLALEWTEDAKRSVDDAEVLTELEPPYSVSEFRLQGYSSVSFPSWVMRIDAYLPSLISIDMCDLPNCNKLPPLGRLPKLKRLKIRRIDSIKRIDVDLYGGTNAFPLLEEFHIDSMKCLEEWNAASSDMFSYSGRGFPCLRNIEIRHCPRLKLKSRPAPSTLTFGSLLGLASVPSLIKCSSTEFLLGLNTLETLTIEDCESVASLPETLGDLMHLRELHIVNCIGIKTLPDSILKLTSLERLVIIGCPELDQWRKSMKKSKMRDYIKRRLDLHDGSQAIVSIPSPSARIYRDVTWGAIQKKV